MSDFVRRLVDAVQEPVEHFRQKTYPSFRNRLAQTVLDLGGAKTGMDAKRLLHEGGNYSLTRKLGEVLPPDLAANLSDFGYLGNETFTGALSKASGRPFFSDYGFRWQDVAMNRQGQDRAISDLLAEKALETARQAEIEREGRGRLPFSGKQ